MTHKVKGCCPLDCPDTCSWVAHVSEGRVERVEGARDHPFTRGGLCAKVRAYQERTYAADRLLHPLKRVGAKGSGQFEKISWDEAITIITDRFKTIIDQDGPQALLPMYYLGSMGVVQRQALMRVFNGLGSTQIHGNICGASGAILMDDGHPIGFDTEELIHSRLIVLWGSNALTTGHHQWHFMKESRRRHGTRIICIDPRRTVTAKHCDQHISIRPGTDGILAAGIAHLMLKENLADLEYTKQVASDFDAYCDSVNAWTPDRVAKACDVPEEVVLALAREFGQAKPAAIRCGVGPQQNMNGDEFVRSLSALSILGGHWRSPGGGMLIETYPIMNEAAAASPELATGQSRSLDMALLGQHLNDTAMDPPIKALMVWNMNPAVVLPDTAEVWRGLAREDLFTVVLEHFMTDTARFADIVLPSTTQLEHFDLQGAWGHQYISVNNPAVTPLGASRSHGEVMRLLAKKLGLTHPEFQASDEDIAASALPNHASLDQLKIDGWKKSPAPRPQLELSDERLTLTSQAVVPAVEDHGQMLQLLTPKSHNFLNSSYANMPRQRKAQGDPALEMHPDDASHRGLVDGEQVLMKNNQGKLHVELKVTDTVRSGVVALPGKWWSQPKHTGAISNLLTPPSWSPGGQPAYNDTFIQVVPIK